MINKQNLWFLTLFSLILVLSVYYITMPNDLLLNNNGTEDKKSDKKAPDNTDKVIVDVTESEILVALRIDLDETRQTMKSDLEGVLTNGDSTTDEKNNAYEQLKYLEIVIGQEAKIETEIKTVYKLDAFVEINNNEIEIVIANKKHDNTLANNIMRTVQSQYTEPMYITVKFK